MVKPLTDLHIQHWSKEEKCKGQSNARNSNYDLILKVACRTEDYSTAMLIEARGFPHML